jgi:hypothetical protein
MSCSPLKVNLRFGGKYRLHLQGEPISLGINQHEASDIEQTTQRYIQ